MPDLAEGAALRVLVTHRLPDGSLDPLLDAGHDVIAFDGGSLVRAVRGVDGVICLLTDRIDADVITAGLPGLRVLANVAVGYDNIDVSAATRAGVTVCNTPGVLDETTADLAFALILMASRCTMAAEAALRGGAWTGWDMNEFLGVDVHGATLGVVGWGRIGQAVARRAAGFGIAVLHHARRPTDDAGYVPDLDDLLAAADVVTLHVPLSDATRHLIDARRLRLMKRSAVLVNTARGAVVDEAALADALHDGAIFAAGLDVFEAEPAVHPRLLTAPRAVLLPHIGSATISTRVEMGRSAARAVVDVLAGRTPANILRA